VRQMALSQGSSGRQPLGSSAATSLPPPGSSAWGLRRAQEEALSLGVASVG